MAPKGQGQGTGRGGVDPCEPSPAVKEEREWELEGRCVGLGLDTWTQVTWRSRSADRSGLAGLRRRARCEF
jgi:hypothetical protein